MHDSKFNSLAMPLALAGSDAQAYDPALLVQAGNKPLRVMVRNTSEAIDVQLAFDAATLQSLPVASGVYLLPAGFCDVFVLAPKQSLYGIANGSGCQVSIATSEALPFDMKP